MQEQSSNNDEDFMRRVFQLASSRNAASGTLQFDQSEFSRLPNDTQNMPLVTPEILRQVADALHQSLTTGRYNVILERASSLSFIAAQFKNVAMKGSILEPRVIEAALTKIFDNLQLADSTCDTYDELKNFRGDKFDFSYSHDSTMAARGVRSFTIKGKQ